MLEKEIELVLTQHSAQFPEREEKEKVQKITRARPSRSSSTSWRNAPATASRWRSCLITSSTM